MSAIAITGGAGFIGVNLADHLLEQGNDVVILDNLSRAGVDGNLDWLKSRHGKRVRHVLGDVRDRELVESVVAGCAFVYHLAAQVAVTTSFVAPREDHDINVVGTLNVLEAIRRESSRPGLLFASTNKVYGALEDLELRVEPQRYAPVDEAVRTHGVAETRGLDFISPYGCSKGAADQYVLDYGRSYGLRAVVFRMSCIYGPHQQANSDQGWVAHFLRSALARSPLTVFGDGRQVRDILHVDDFVAALSIARLQIEALSGRAYNIGGGTANTLSLLELISLARRLCGRDVDFCLDARRPGDQRWFAADIRGFASVTGWTPRIAPLHGIEQLWSWLREDGVARRGSFAQLRRMSRA